MKKAKSILALLLTLCVGMGLVACGGNDRTTDERTAEPHPESDLSQTAELDKQSTAGETHVLVAYFSATGNTAEVAEKIAALTGGDLYEIVPSEPYTPEDLDYTNEQSRTSLEMDDPHTRPAVGGEPVSLSGYTTLYLGYPIWHGQAPRIISTFVENYDFKGITVIPFCTSGGSGIGDSGRQLAELAGSGNWLEGERFSSSVSQEDVKAWIESFQ
ncbi:MAG: flavodoxin [Clostridia bacterium]